MKRLVIFGDQTAQEIEKVALEVYGSTYQTISTCYISDDFDETSFAKTSAKSDYIIGVWDSKIRSRIQELAQRHNLYATSVIHPSAYIANTAKIDAGCFISPLSAIGDNAVVGPHSLLHFHASIGHNCTLGSDCWVLPGARLSGNVKLGQGCLIGSNSFIRQGTELSDFVKVDALTYIDKDVPARRTVSGRRPLLGN